MAADNLNPERGLILRSNQLAREGRIDAKHAPFAEHLCRIPVQDWHALALLFPGLDSTDRDTREAAMARFHASPVSDPYRVRKNKRRTG